MKRLLPGIMMGQPSWENMEDERTGICEMFPPCAGNVFFLFFVFCFLLLQILFLEIRIFLPILMSSFAQIFSSGKAKASPKSKGQEVSFFLQ